MFCDGLENEQCPCLESGIGSAAVFYIKKSLYFGAYFFVLIYFVPVQDDTKKYF